MLFWGECGWDTAAVDHLTLLLRPLTTPAKTVAGTCRYICIFAPALARLPRTRTKASAWHGSTTLWPDQFCFQFGKIMGAGGLAITIGCNRETEPISSPINYSNFVIYGANWRQVTALGALLTGLTGPTNGLEFRFVCSRVSHMISKFMNLRRLLVNCLFNRFASDDG